MRGLVCRSCVRCFSKPPEDSPPVPPKHVALDTYHEWYFMICTLLYFIERLCLLTDWTCHKVTFAVLHVQNSSFLSFPASPQVAKFGVIIISDNYLWPLSLSYCCCPHARISSGKWKARAADKMWSLHQHCEFRTDLGLHLDWQRLQITELRGHFLHSVSVCYNSCCTFPAAIKLLSVGAECNVCMQLFSLLWRTVMFYGVPERGSSIASAGTSRGICRDRGHNKRYTL